LNPLTEVELMLYFKIFGDQKNILNKLMTKTTQNNILIFLKYLTNKVLSN